jgi:nitroimidazol reductase NimA-like FMN-containing flavoprotein (pyridoxamine 5'-phosphate oxidase superfamily)
MPKRKSAGQPPSPKASRPYMPGYGLPAADDGRGLLPWKWAQARIRKSHNYWIATSRADGTPHVMPVWGIWVDAVFYFSTGRNSRKARNLAENPRCVVCNEQAHEAVVVEGTAEEITDTALLKRLGPHYSKKYKPWKLDPKLGPIYAVRPRVAFGLCEKLTLNSATRWKFEQ